MQYVKNLGNIQIAILFLILANIIWGIALPIYKWSLEEVPTFMFVFLRFFLGSLILLPFVIKKLKIARQDYKNLILASLFSATFQIPLLFIGLKLTPSINAPIIIAFAPIILIVASVIFLKERPTSKVIIGTIISLIGILAIILRPVLESGFSGSVIGSLLIFAATVCGVIQTILLKKLTVRNDPLSIVFWICFLGSLPLIPFALWEAQSFSLINDITVKGVIGIAYAIYFSTIIAHYFYVYGTKYIKASEVGIFSYVDPIATIVVAIPLLNEVLTPVYVVGAIFVFAGIFIAENRIHYHPVHKLFKKA